MLNVTFPDSGTLLSFKWYFQVRAMVQGRDRRVELGYQWAIELRKNIIYPPKNKNCKYNPVIDQSPNQSQDTNGTSAPANGNPETDNSQQPEVTASAWTCRSFYHFFFLFLLSFLLGKELHSEKYSLALLDIYPFSLHYHLWKLLYN